jgi:hypothetical protein
MGGTHPHKWAGYGQLLLHDQLCHQLRQPREGAVGDLCHKQPQIAKVNDHSNIFPPESPAIEPSSSRWRGASRVRAPRSLQRLIDRYMNNQTADIGPAVKLG